MTTIEEIERESRHRRVFVMMTAPTERTAEQKAVWNGKLIPKPKVGDTLYITTSRGIPTRRRVGLDFNAEQPRAVEIVSGNEVDVAKRVTGGESVCSELGYFDLMGDDGLVCHAMPLDGDQLAELKAAAESSKANADGREKLRLELLEQKAASDAALAAKDARIAELEAAAKGKSK